MVLSDFQAGPNNPSTVSGNSTATLYFSRPSSLGVQTIGSAGGYSLIPSPSATSATGQLVVPGLNALNGQPFNIRAAGDFGSDTGDASGTVQITLYANIGTISSPIYTTIASTGAVVPGFASAEPWSINSTMQGTTSSGLCGGTYTVMVGGQKVGAANQSTPILSGINFGASVPFGFVVGVRFGTGDASNKARLLQFNITQGY